MALAWPVIRELMAIRTRLDECLDESRFPGASPAAAGGAGDSFSPVADLFEDEKNLVLVMEVPGVDVSELSATIQAGQLRLSGPMAALESGAESGRFLRMERPDGGFSRDFELPVAVNPESLDCEVERGVLTVVIEKHQKSTPAGEREVSQ